MLGRWIRTAFVRRPSGGSPAEPSEPSTTELDRALTAFHACLHVFQQGRGLEIGGPSATFRDPLVPVYLVAQQIDNCNFGHRTAWEGELSEDKPFVFDPARPPGRQFIAEGAQLDAVADGSYDYLLSCHSLEHLANPLRALENWRRVLRDGGVLLLILPHKEGTFDHLRPVTALAHLEADLANDVGEDDLTHLAEVLDLHDAARDAEFGDPAAFRLRCEHNAENRSLHHHVFDTRLAVQMLDRAGFQLIAVQPAATMHIILFAQKLSQPVDNARFLGVNGPVCWTSPFASDNAA
jgi:SAM-dependent methyltransferase